MRQMLNALLPPPICCCYGFSPEIQVECVGTHARIVLNFGFAISAFIQHAEQLPMISGMIEVSDEVLAGITTTSLLDNIESRIVPDLGKVILLTPDSEAFMPLLLIFNVED